MNNAWLDFIICLFFGLFGVHKFKEGKIFLGFVYLFTGGLLTIGWIVDCVRYFKAAQNGVRISGQHIYNENAPLPVVSSNLLLTNGELCHYSSTAYHIKTKNVVVGYQGGHVGGSIRVAKGMSLRIGSSKGAPIRGDIEQKTPGLLSITNKRIVFSANTGAFDKPLSSLSSITPYSNGIAFQFGSTQYPLETKDSEYIYKIIARIINESETTEN